MWYNFFCFIFHNFTLCDITYAFAFCSLSWKIIHLNKRLQISDFHLDQLKKPFSHKEFSVKNTDDYQKLCINHETAKNTVQENYHLLFSAKRFLTSITCNMPTVTMRTHDANENQFTLAILLSKRYWCLPDLARYTPWKLLTVSILFRITSVTLWKINSCKISILSKGQLSDTLECRKWQWLLNS